MFGKWRAGEKPPVLPPKSALFFFRKEIGFIHFRLRASCQSLSQFLFSLCQRGRFRFLLIWQVWFSSLGSLFSWAADRRWLADRASLQLPQFHSLLAHV